MKFSKANAKLEALYNVPELDRWFANKRKVYSFDLLSGWSCPFASECLSKVHVIDGTKKLIDGPETKFRCFSASQEVAFPSAYNLRNNNFQTLRVMKSSYDMAAAISDVMPSNLGICRIHVAGDFFSQLYFRAWILLAEWNPDRLFYAYTKSLRYWLTDSIGLPDNVVLTASRGGRLDHLINCHNMREARVVFSEQQADELGLEIDHDDSHAAVPEWRNTDFALLIHGIQPAGSEAAEAIKLLKKNKVRFSYSKG